MTVSGAEIYALISPHLKRKCLTLLIGARRNASVVKLGSGLAIGNISERIFHAGGSLESRRIGGIVGSELVVYAIEGNLDAIP